MTDLEVDPWIDRILSEFQPDLARLWIAADPDGVLLDERLLALLRQRGFELLPFEDSVAFRADYEERYRAAWDRGEPGPAKALTLHHRSDQTDELPWDYLRQARVVRLSLADLFPALSYGVVRRLSAELLAPLFEAQVRQAPQPLGEAATKEFILTHLFGLDPRRIVQPEDLWRELLRLHYRGAGLPPVLAAYIEQTLGRRAAFQGLPIAELFSSRRLLLRSVQQAWRRRLQDQGVEGVRVGESAPAGLLAGIDLPFDHPDVRALVDALFLDGALQPLMVQSPPTGIPDWAKLGVVQDPAALRNRVLDSAASLLGALPTLESSHRDWTQFAQRFADMLYRFHRLEATQANEIEDRIIDMQRRADERLRGWVEKHYADLSSLPAAKAPVMGHHVPRFLALRRNGGEHKIALLVFDGLALDQWIQIREHVARRSPGLGFEENACFAWLPTLTSVARQALFSGLKPREFADSIDTTAREPTLWSRFWQDQGLRANEALYRKGVRRREHLEELTKAVSSPSVKAVGVVVDMVDEIAHGAALGKRGVAGQIELWCESGVVERLFALLLERGFHVYLTADHGNVDAVGVGKPNQGALAEKRGERVRIYRSEALLAESAAACPATFRLNVAGLPPDFMPLFAGERAAFITPGEPCVAHGGLSVEELITPWVKIIQTGATA